MIIRLFLIASILVAAWWLVRGQSAGKRLAVTRLAGIGVAGAAVVAVLAPGIVTEAANFVGVREGPNLLLYVLVVVFAFTTIVQTGRLRDLEGRLARVARAQALLEAEVRASEAAADPLRAR